jgi:hypothetical protein
MKDVVRVHRVRVSSVAVAAHSVKSIYVVHAAKISCLSDAYARLAAMRFESEREGERGVGCSRTI